jgi:hypothetical protein
MITACIFFFWQINQADFELVKVMQEKKRLSAKIVHSPEKLQVGCMFVCFKLLQA